MNVTLLSLHSYILLHLYTERNVIVIFVKKSRKKYCFGIVKWGQAFKIVKYAKKYSKNYV